MSFRPKRILRLQMIIKPPERWFRGLFFTWIQCWTEEKPKKILLQYANDSGTPKKRFF